MLIVETMVAANSKRRMSCILGLFLLAGCVFPPPAPTTLKFNSLKLKDPDTLEVSFSSDSNLVQYIKHWGNPRVVAAACNDFKHYGEMRQDESGGYVPSGPLGMTAQDDGVYWHDMEILNSSWDAESKEQTIEREFRLSPEAWKSEKPYIYRFFLSTQKRFKYPEPQQYDLRAGPVDICFQLQSAEVAQPGARSNIVVVPKESLQAVLRAK